MKEKNSIFKVAFGLISVSILLVSYKLLFIDRGFCNILHSQATLLMLKELFIYFALFCLSGLLEKYRIYILGGLVVIFTYSHCMLLPLLACTFYCVQIILLGHWIDEKIFKKFGQKIAVYFEFLVGVSANIIAFAVMSILGIGKILYLQCFVAVTGGLLLAKYYKIFFRKMKSAISFLNSQYNMIVIIVLFLMIAIGRAAIAIDYDSIWYGVRGALVLDNGKGIYENLNLTGCVYTYPKGFEILALPTSESESFGYIYMLNIIFSIYIIALSWSCTKELIGKEKAYIVAIMVSSVPGIMNMATTAKSDILTVIIQLISFYAGILFVKEEKKLYFEIALFAYILSLAFKPTAIIYSTAIFVPILFIYIMHHKKIKGDSRCLKIQILSVGTLFLVWLRTYMLTGMPAMSVWAGLFSKFGFKVKYPYTTSVANRGSNFRSVNTWFTRDVIYNAIERIKNFYLAPITEDMDHIVIVWGTVLITILTLVSLIIFIFGIRKFIDKFKSERIFRFVMFIFMIQFGGSIVTLWIGTKPDGNYFMLYYAISIISLGCFIVNNINALVGEATYCIRTITGLYIIYNLIVTSTTNWAWAQGFTPISWKNCGYYNNREQLKQRFAEWGVNQLYDEMCSSTRNRVMVFGKVDYWNLNCISEPYIDISYWGNGEIVSSPENYCDYLRYVQCDYIFVENGFVGTDSNEYCLLMKLFDENMVENVEEENGHILLDLGECDNNEFEEELKKEFINTFEYQIY